MWAKSLFVGNHDQRVLIGSVAGKHRLNCFAKFLERDLGVTVNVKTANDRYQLCLDWLMSHLLKEESNVALSQVFEALFIDCFKGFANTEVWS